MKNQKTQCTSYFTEIHKCSWTLQKWKSLQVNSYKLNHNKKFPYKRMVNVIDAIFKVDQNKNVHQEVPLTSNAKTQ